MKLVASGAKPDPGESIFTTSGTFIVPGKVKEVEVFLVGGGGRGSGNASPDWYGDSFGGGGGGGYTKTEKLVVANGENINITVAASAGNSIAGDISVEGGKSPGGIYKGGDGGSGGGGKNASGGSDGSDGGKYDYADMLFYGSGQHTTTRAFGESDGTLYAGGGGGYGGVGGAGGGGDSGWSGSNGSANTGGGGGACYLDSQFGCTPGDGGSGIVIVRWGY